MVQVLSKGEESFYQQIDFLLIIPETNNIFNYSYNLITVLQVKLFIVYFKLDEMHPAGCWGWVSVKYMCL